MRSVRARNIGKVACILRYQGVRSLASSAPALTDEIDRFAQYHPTTLSLQKFIDFGELVLFYVEIVVPVGSEFGMQSIEFGKSTLSEQPGFCEFVFELRWPVVPGFERRCSWCSG